MSLKTHPLDPLTLDEIQKAIAVILASPDIGPRFFFEQVRLLEPRKQIVRSFTIGDKVNREAFAIVWSRDTEKVFEVVVSLREEKVVSWKNITGVQPVIVQSECEELERIAKQHPDLIAGLNARGITNLDQVSIGILAVGNFLTADEKHRRLMRGRCFFVENPGDNPHVRPIEGLVPVADLNKMEIIRVEDTGIVAIPPDRGEYRYDQLPARAPQANLDITQPDGPGFIVEGHLVKWNSWQFRVGFTPKEGLVLHTLEIRDKDAIRPVIYRASLSELVVPYADTAHDHYMNHSFDLGEGVFGAQVNSLTLGCDCVGEIYYFDVDRATETGHAETMKNAICMHEEDYGILWKHTDSVTGNTEVRRSRRLVISSFFTIGNYDYGLFWYLYLDGTIEFEAKLTGMLYTRAVEAGLSDEYGTIVAPSLNAMIHEHYFNVRLDMSVDGDQNTAIEIDARRIPTSENNPHGNAHGIAETIVRSESESGRDSNPDDARYWKIINQSKVNSLGWPSGYKLMPGKNMRPMHQPNSAFLRRAGFVNHDLWITAFDPEQLHAPGSFVNQNEYGPGLPEWTQANRNLVDTDIVVWHTFGLMHVPRPEDFPIMPVEYIGFMLKPVGFFERNPSLSVCPSVCYGNNT